MPGLNGTGPVGSGPQTGRGLGRCNPRNQNGDSQGIGGFFRRGAERLGRGRGIGRGLGQRNGLGQGRGWRFW